MTTLAIFSRPFAMGPNSRVSPTTKGATRRATRSVCWMANVLGVTSANTNSSSVMATVAMTSPRRWIRRTASWVARVVPPTVASMVSSSTTFRYRGGFSTIRWRDGAPRRFSSTRW